MITFTTETGSVYELDEENHRMRRVSGNHYPTANQRSDGGWREYESVSLVAPGERVLVVWGLEDPRPDEQFDVPVLTVLRRTLTSLVTKVNY